MSAPLPTTAGSQPSVDAVPAPSGPGAQNPVPLTTTETPRSDPTPQPSTSRNEPQPQPPTTNDSLEPASKRTRLELPPAEPTPTMALNAVRDYIYELKAKDIEVTRLRQSLQLDCDQLRAYLEEHDVKSKVFDKRNKDFEKTQYSLPQSTLDQLKQELKLKNESAHEPFELYTPCDDLIPDTWQPQPGIIHLPFRHHKTRVIETTSSLSETGFALHPMLQTFINAKYPQYLHIPKIYCRPLGTTIAAPSTTLIKLNLLRDQYPPTGSSRQ